MIIIMSCAIAFEVDVAQTCCLLVSPWHPTEHRAVGAVPAVLGV